MPDPVPAPPTEPAWAHPQPKPAPAAAPVVVKKEVKTTERVPLLHEEGVDPIGDLDDPAPVLPYPLMFYYVTMIITILIRTFDGKGKNPYIDYSRPVTYGAGVFQAIYCAGFLVVAVWQICVSFGGVSRWKLMKARQHNARNAYIFLTMTAIGALCVLDFVIIALLGSSTRAFVALFQNVCGYTACFLTWLGPPRHAILCQFGHLFFGACVMGLRLYQLSNLTDEAGHFQFLYTLHTFAELLVIYELGHVVLGVQYFHYHPKTGSAA
eukprot:m.198279 g.198279  ORF g.198279 m.198279 type:complete len:267 (+) comp20399_c0_seq1:209-1009(+)